MCCSLLSLSQQIKDLSTQSIKSQERQPRALVKKNEACRFTSGLLVRSLSENSLLQVSARRHRPTASLLMCKVSFLHLHAADGRCHLRLRCHLGELQKLPSTVLNSFQTHSASESKTSSSSINHI